jgi:hypothetical protein
MDQGNHLSDARYKKLRALLAGLGAPPETTWIQPSTGGDVELTRAPAIFFTEGTGGFSGSSVNLDTDKPAVDGDELTVNVGLLDTPWTLNPGAGVFMEDPALPAGAGSSPTLSFANAVRASWKFCANCIHYGGANVWLCTSGS